MKKIHILFLSIFLIFIPISFSSEVFAAPKNPPKPPCRIDIHNAHISTTLRRKTTLHYVKVKAESVCNVQQSQVVLTVEIYKTGLFTDHLVWKDSTKKFDSHSSGLEVRNWFTQFLCKNTTDTSTYYGIAYSAALVGGKQMYAGRTRSPQNETLACGT